MGDIVKNIKGVVVAVTSSKGGVGKTIFATNLLGVYETLKKKVLLIDMDLSCGGVNVLLNLPKTKTIYNLADDILNNRFKNYDDYVYRYSDYVGIIPSCKDPRQGNKIDGKIIEQVIAIYKNYYEIVLIDTTHIPTNVTVTSLDIADKIMFMITDNPLDLKNSASMLAILKKNKENVFVVLNESYRNEKSYFSKFDIKSVIKYNIDFVLPSSMYINNINKFIMDGRILVLNNKLSFRNNRDRELMIKIAEIISDNTDK